MKGLAAVLAGLALGGWSAPPARADVLLAGALLAAGGGPAAFKSTTLLGFLAGDDPGIALARLTAVDGAENVKRSIEILDFCVRDARRLKAIRVLDAATASPNVAAGGENLTRALYAAGVRPVTGSFTTPTLMTRLLSHDARRTVIADATARFGKPSVATFEREIARVLGNLHARYVRE